MVYSIANSTLSSISSAVSLSNEVVAKFIGTLSGLILGVKHFCSYRIQLGT